MWKRLKELLLKFLGVKGVFAVGATVIYVLSPTTQNNFYLILIAWGLLIGTRELFKIVKVIKEVKDEVQ